METQDEKKIVSSQESEPIDQDSGSEDNLVSEEIDDVPKENGNSEEKLYEFSGLQNDTNKMVSEDMDFILDIPLEITVELGRTTMLINDLLKLGQGSIIELAKSAGETLEILANNRLIAKGDVVVINDKYGIRLTEVVTTVERIEKLG
jgi:flagellar motor switch protein FliN/FliY